MTTTKRKSPRPHHRSSAQAIKVRRMLVRGAYAAMVRGKREYLEDRLVAIRAAIARKKAAMKEQTNESK
jgi:hypothetical protein